MLIAVKHFNWIIRL